MMTPSLFVLVFRLWTVIDCTLNHHQTTTLAILSSTNHISLVLVFNEMLLVAISTLWAYKGHIVHMFLHEATSSVIGHLDDSQLGHCILQFSPCPIWTKAESDILCVLPNIYANARRSGGRGMHLI